MRSRFTPLLFLSAGLVATTTLLASSQEKPTGQGFSFKTGVDLINVAATVTDDTGRFVPSLRREDFVLYEDGKQQEISQFEAERVPVSLGIMLDTSGSMLGEKFTSARIALDRFLVDLLGPEDEVFLYRFDSRPELIQGWTSDRRLTARMLGSVTPRGGTALYDTVTEAVPLAQAGKRPKKALVIISDGQDTSSRTQLPEVQQLIREAEVMVYAIGIDASGGYSRYPSSSPSGPSQPTSLPQPSPFPGRPSRLPPPIVSRPSYPPPSRMPGAGGSSDRVNVDALRSITDDSGGRTEIILSPRDIDPATAGIADELSKQYFLGYVSSLPKDGRWHTIEVQVRRGNYLVRARKGFIAN